ncbi:unnamed protein product [Amaranthus hypochondriacus]
MKAEKKWWSRVLRGDVKPPHNVKIDWGKWVDEDEDNGTAPANFDLGGMDFSVISALSSLFLEAAYASNTPQYLASP